MNFMENTHWILEFQRLLRESQIDVGRYNPEEDTTFFSRPIPLNRRLYRKVPLLEARDILLPENKPDGDNIMEGMIDFNSMIMHTQDKTGYIEAHHNLIRIPEKKVEIDIVREIVPFGKISADPTNYRALNIFSIRLKKDKDREGNTIIPTFGRDFVDWSVESETTRKPCQLYSPEDWAVMKRYTGTNPEKCIRTLTNTITNFLAG